jgi:hypothetical protein
MPSGMSIATLGRDLAADLLQIQQHAISDTISDCSDEGLPYAATTT